MASNEGGVPEVVEHGVTGMLMDPKAAERYASSDAKLPEDLEVWVNEGYEAL